MELLKKAETEKDYQAESEFLSALAVVGKTVAIPHLVEKLENAEAKTNNATAVQSLAEFHDKTVGRKIGSLAFPLQFASAENYPRTFFHLYQASLKPENQVKPRKFWDDLARELSRKEDKFLL